MRKLSRSLRRKRGLSPVDIFDGLVLCLSADDTGLRYGS